MYIPFEKVLDQVKEHGSIVFETNPSDADEIEVLERLRSDAGEWYFLFIDEPMVAVVDDRRWVKE